MKNEVTGKKAAAIAGKLLAELAKVPRGGAPTVHVGWFIFPRWKGMAFATRITKDLSISVADLKALAASALTQAPDRKRR